MFSVLFALFIDRMATNAKTNELKKTALNRIHNELSENQKLFEQLINRHDTIIQNLNAATLNENDSLSRRIATDGYLNWRLLANGKSLFPSYPSKTSWEAAKSTGIISEFDYQTIEAFEGIYTLQELIVNTTLQKTIDDLFDIDRSQIDQKLIKLRLKFEEIRDQETTLLRLLEEALNGTK